MCLYKLTFNLHMQTCIYVYVYTFVNIYVHFYVCMFVSVYMYIYMYQDMICIPMLCMYPHTCEPMCAQSYLRVCDFTEEAGSLRPHGSRRAASGAGRIFGFRPRINMLHVYMYICLSTCMYMYR